MNNVYSRWVCVKPVFGVSNVVMRLTTQTNTSERVTMMAVCHILMTRKLNEKNNANRPDVYAPKLSGTRTEFAG